MPPKKHRTITVRAHQASLPLKISAVKKAVETFLSHEGVATAELSFIFLSSADMRRLNRQFLGHDFVTDVVTFDLRREREGGRGTKRLCKGRLSSFTLHPAELEGEIFICPAEARRNAREYGEPAAREILRYVAHGILHLLGHDDGNVRARKKMRVKEDELLELLS